MQKATVIKIYLLLLAFIFMAFAIQEPIGAISGKVSNPSKQPVDGVKIKVTLFDKVVGIDTTDEEGFYYIKPLVPDNNYIIAVTHDSFRAIWMDSVRIMGDRTTFQNFNLADRGYDGKEVDSVHYKIPSISKFSTKQNIDPSVKRDCPKKYKNQRCPVCRKVKVVIPVEYDLIPMTHCYSGGSYRNIVREPYVHYYPGGYNKQECVPKYYCKKDSLLF